MNITQNQIEKILESEAGKLWENYGKRRIYINVKTALNMEISYYKTGNICSCYIDGERISNRKARGIISGKCFIDLNNDNKVVFQWASDEMIEFIEAYLNELEEEQEEQEEQEEEKMTKLTWKKPSIYNSYDVDSLCYLEVSEWDSYCGNFRIHKVDSDTRFFINKKVMVELYDINDELFEEETFVLFGNKEGYSTLEQAQNACIEEV